MNNVIVGNGEDAANRTGGVYINGDPPDAIAVLDFNTIADNVRGASEPAGGIYCGLSTAFAAANNIVWSNTPEQVVGNCTFTYSDVQGGATGPGNIDLVPQFVQALADYHIRSTSPCRGAADPAATVLVDLDGEARPEGARADIGADEYWP